MNYSSSSSSTNKFQVLTTTTNTSIKNTGVILQKSDSKQNSKEELEWWIQNLKICNGRYLTQLHSQVLIQTDVSRKGWGAVCQGISTGEQWSKEEQLLHINVFELKATFDLQQTKIFESSSFLNRQHHCTTLPCENGGNREPNVTEIKQRNLAVSLETPDHNYCGIPSKFFECGGRLQVSKQQGLIRMETLPKSISTSLPEDGNAQSRFVYIKAVSPTTPVLCLETRTFQLGDRCPTADLGQSIPLCISPILSLSTSLEESELRPNRKNVFCHTNLAVSKLVPPSTRNVYSSSTVSSKEHKLKKPTRGSSSSNCKQNVTTSGVDHIRERLLKKGVSETARRPFSLITKSILKIKPLRIPKQLLS